MEDGIISGVVSKSVVMFWFFWPYEPSLAPKGCHSGLVGNLLMVYKRMATLQLASI